MHKIIHVFVITAVVVVIGAIMIPGANAVSKAFALHHNHLQIHQEISQLNVCTGRSVCENHGQNTVTGLEQEFD
jgi:hypothetical protein